MTPFGFFPWTFDAVLVHLRAQGRLGVVPGWHTRHVARTHAVYYRDSRGGHIPTIPVLKRILAVLDEQLLIGVERTNPEEECEREIAPAPEALSA